MSGWDAIVIIAHKAVLWKGYSSTSLALLDVRLLRIVGLILSAVTDDKIRVMSGLNIIHLHTMPTMDHLASTSSSADTTISQDVSLASSLPSEILSQIFSYVQYQDSLFACSLTCRSWYESAVPELYKHPQIVGPNFDAFVKAICPSKNAHIRRNGLAELVRVLDMARLIHHSRRSLTARLLSRTKYDLECFIAPQASFGYA